MKKIKCPVCGFQYRKLPNRFPLHCSCMTLISETGTILKTADGKNLMKLCPYCGHKQNIRKFPHTCEFCEHTFKENEVPSTGRRLKNFSIALIKHIVKSAPTCSQEEFDERFVICKACDLFNGQMCTHKRCGCTITERKQFLNKIAWKDQACPLQKWGVPLRKLITITITTFKRPEALDRLLKSIKKFYPLLPVEIQDTKGNLSWGRNELGKKVKTPYFLMLEDDFEFTENTNIETLLQVLQEDSEIVGCGGAAYDQIWAHDLEPFRGELRSVLPREKVRVTNRGVQYQPCNIILNFGLFRTELYKTIQWDEDLQLWEHTEFYYRLMMGRQWKVAVAKGVSVAHHHDRNPEYREYRHRNFKEAQEAKLGMFVSAPKDKFEWRETLSPMQEKIKQATIDFNRNFNQVFPICGTLLGMLREGQPIPHDTDGDFGTVHWTKIKRRVGPFKLNKIFHHNGEQCEAAYIHENGIKIDLFRFFEENNQRYWVCWPDEMPNKETIIKYFPKEITDQLISHIIWGESFRIFNQSEKWLEINYGPDWRTPNPEFSYHA